MFEALWSYLAWLLLLFQSLVRGGSQHPPVTIKRRRFEIGKLLGEGGYAMVYLAKEIGTKQGPRAGAASQVYALKKVLAHSEEKLELVNKEIQLHAGLQHPSILKLLEYEIVMDRSPPTTGGAASSRVPGQGSGGIPASVEMAGTSEQGFVALDLHAGSHLGQLPGEEDGIKATAYMLFPAYCEGTLADEIARRHASQDRLSRYTILTTFQQLCEALQYLHDQKALSHRDVKPHNVLIKALGASYEAVLMDFGSAGVRHVPVATRRDALALQEQAEAHCTATYRAAELFDVPTGAPLDYAKCDVWSAGCTLYHLMYGASPFQKAIDQPGGSIALAVLNSSIPWPREGDPKRYPEDMHDIVKSCLAPDPGLRPSARQLCQRVSELMRAS